MRVSIIVLLDNAPSIKHATSIENFDLHTKPTLTPIWKKNKIKGKTNPFPCKTNEYRNRKSSGNAVPVNSDWISNCSQFERIRNLMIRRHPSQEYSCPGAIGKPGGTDFVSACNMCPENGKVVGVYSEWECWWFDMVKLVLFHLILLSKNYLKCAKKYVIYLFCFNMNRSKIYIIGLNYQKGRAIINQ